MNGLRKRLPVVFALALTLFLPAAAWACPSCKDGLEQGQEHLIQSYFWSILFMMSMPFVIFGSLSAYFYYEVCRARARQMAAATSALSVEM